MADALWMARWRAWQAAGMGPWKRVEEVSVIRTSEHYVKGETYAVYESQATAAVPERVVVPVLPTMVMKRSQPTTPRAERTE